MFAVPLANSMEAIWAVTLLRATLGKLYTPLSMKKSVWRANFTGSHAGKDPEFNSRRNDTLNAIMRSHVFSCVLTCLRKRHRPMY